MSKLIVNKIDDILGSYSTNGYASSSIGNYSDTLGMSKNILNNIEANLHFAEENELMSKLSSKNSLNNKSNSDIPTDSIYSSTSANSNTKRKKINSPQKIQIENSSNPKLKINHENRDFEKSDKQKNEINQILNEIKKEKINTKTNDNKKNINSVKKDKFSDKTNKKKEIQNKKLNNVFMTKVEIEGEVKSSSEEETKIPYEEDDLLDSSDDDFKINPELKKEMNDFKNLLTEINDLKKGMKNEFDELQYLIKYVDRTSNRVNRHFNGISNLFQQSGIKPKTDNVLHKLREEAEENDDEFDDEYDRKNNIYNKEKNMNRIKDNLIHLQDNFIGYYKNFDGGMKNIESNVSKCKHMLLYEKKKMRK